MARRIGTIVWIACLLGIGIYALSLNRGPIDLASRLGPALLENAEPAPFTFAVLGDVHAYRRPLREALLEAKNRGCDFLIQLGDFVDYDDEVEYRDFADYVRPLTRDLPLFLVRGNHETMSIDGGFSDVYLCHVPKPYYQFRHKGCIFVIFDDSSGVIAQPQIEELQKAIAQFREHNPVGQVFLFMHMPPDTPSLVSADMSDNSSSEILELARQFKISAVFAGHMHAYQHTEAKGIPLVVTGCGGGSIGAPSTETHMLQVSVHGNDINIAKVPLAREWRFTAIARYAFKILAARYRHYVLAAVLLLLAIEVWSLIRRRQYLERKQVRREISLNASLQPAIYAIVPAAGHSRRMGRAKQLIPIDGRPMLHTVVENIAASDVTGVMVVTRRVIVEAISSPHIDKVFAAYNEDESSEMIDSIRIGIRAWQDRQSIQPDAGFLLCPADHPGISVQDINTCIHAFRDSPSSIIIASFTGRRGHPLIFPAVLADFVLSPACDNGLNALPHAMPDRVKLVPCNSIGVLKDIDTPEDLSSL